LPVGPNLQYTSEKPADTITLFIYTGKDAAFTLYEDEGTNYNYEKGAYANIPIYYNQAKKTLTIAQRKGNFPGMLTARTFNIVWVTSNKGVAADANDVKPAATIHYTGTPVNVAMK